MKAVWLEWRNSGVSGSQDGAKESGAASGVRMLGCMGGLRRMHTLEHGQGIDVTQLLFSEDHSDCCLENRCVWEGWAQGVQIGGSTVQGRNHGHLCWGVAGAAEKGCQSWRCWKGGVTAVWHKWSWRYFLKEEKWG